MLAWISCTAWSDEYHTSNQSGVSNLSANDPAYQTFLAPGRSSGMSVKFRL
jgi:hypothetical protein